MSIDTISTPSGRLPLRTVIAQSWRRSELCGVRPDAPVERAAADISAADPLLDAARPALDEAAARITDTNMSLLLVDHECRMVSRVTAGTTIERLLDSAGAARGVALSEATVGTTALGTPAEIRRGLVVNSAEHFLESFKQLSCYGQPIIHPATRRFVGSLCMTEVAEAANPLAIPFVNSIVADISDRLLDRSRAHQRRVLDSFQRAAPRRDVAVAAIGDDLQLTNSLAAEILSPPDIGILRSLVADPSLHETTLRMTMSSGLPVQVAIEPVPGTTGAALFHLHPLPTATPNHHGKTSTTTALAESVAVTGEPGTGRSTEALALAAAALPESVPVVLDVAESLIGGTPPDIATAVAQARHRGSALVIDGADLLDERSVTLLIHATTRSTRTPLIVVTGPSTGLGSAASALVGHCARRVDLPPLRHRTHELAAIATSIVTDLTPEFALSPAATDALISQEWPGNLAELVNVAGAAVAACSARSARRIELTDLPARYRTTSRASRLAGMEQAERQAIIDALERCDHNKVHAAKELGISRTTLYSRIRALGI